VEQDYRNRSSLTPLIKPLMAYMSEEAAVWVAQLLVVHGVELIITRNEVPNMRIIVHHGDKRATSSHSMPTSARSVFF